VALPLQWCGGVRRFFRFATFAALVLSGAALPACFLPRSEPLPEPEGPEAPIDDEPAPPHHPPADACPSALLSDEEDGAWPTSDHVLVNATHVFWDATTELDVGDHRRAIVRAPICGGPTDTGTGAARCSSSRSERPAVHARCTAQNPRARRTT
jgi:hypothetical protein